MSYLTPEKQEMELARSVPQSFRDGIKPAGHTAATAYSNSLGNRNVVAKDISGCYKCQGKYPLLCNPLCLCCNVPCTSDCIWLNAWLGCIPMAFMWCVCSCERDGNAWVMRDKNGFKTGDVLLVDKERGTYACYAVKCCSSEFVEEPTCWFTRAF